MNRAEAAMATQQVTKKRPGKNSNYSNYSNCKKTNANELDLFMSWGRFHSEPWENVLEETTWNEYQISLWESDVSLHAPRCDNLWQPWCQECFDMSWLHVQKTRRVAATNDCCPLWPPAWLRLSCLSVRVTWAAARSRDIYIYIDVWDRGMRRYGSRVKTSHPESYIDGVAIYGTKFLVPLYPNFSF